jgi:hypothetical protein
VVFCPFPYVLVPGHEAVAVIDAASMDREATAADQHQPWPPQAPWPESAEPFTVPWLATGPEVVVAAVLPADDPTEIPVWLAQGGWNTCPDALIHVALARRWRDQRGAVTRSTTLLRHDTAADTSCAGGRDTDSPAGHAEVAG